ncbi:MAG: transporter substrate-binding domain-containing protein [Rhodospirillaceae bacterium]
MFRTVGLAASLFILLHAAGAGADTITIRADDWCPYTCAPNAPKPGYLIDIAREVLGKAGHSVNYEVMPWTRVVSEVQGGQIDAAAGAGHGDVPNGVFSQTSLGKNANVLTLMAERPFTYDGLASLEGLRIGVVANYSYDNGDIDAYIKDHLNKADGRVEAISGSEVQSSNIRKLLAGRIDAVLDNENVLKLAMADLKPKPPVRFVAVGTPDEVYIAFSPTNPKSAEYAKLLDAGIAEMRSNGRLAAVLAAYGLSDWR